MIVTNLQIQTNRIPNNLFAGETLNISLFMTNDNEKITDDDFLQFISFSAQQTSPNKKHWKSVKITLYFRPAMKPFSGKLIIPYWFMILT